eukprot:2502158-Rhodomonas_salina.1
MELWLSDCALGRIPLSISPPLWYLSVNHVLLPHLHSFPLSPSLGNLKLKIMVALFIFESKQECLLAPGPAVPSVPSCLPPSIFTGSFPLPPIPGSY